jgi:hypothetical protein
MCRHVIKEQFAGGVGDTNYLKIFIARGRVAGLLVGDARPPLGGS